MKQKLLETMKESRVKAKEILVVLATLYTLCLIYGSFLPFNFRTPNQALFDQTLFNLFHTELLMPSISDVLGNIIFYIPFGILWGLCITHIFTNIAFVLCSISFHLAIEATQSYLPLRTTSSYDLIANFLGSMLGLLIAWIIKCLFAIVAGRGIHANS
jgi:glycopeptide antibiotics resistance protein